MGEVYRPEDIVHRRGKSVHDLTPRPIPQPIMPTSIDATSQDIESIKVEIAKIKQALRAHGIAIE